MQAVCFIVGRHAAIDRRPPFCGLVMRFRRQLLLSFSGMGDSFWLVLGNVLVFGGVLRALGAPLEKQVFQGLLGLT